MTFRLLISILFCCLVAKVNGQDSLRIGQDTLISGQLQDTIGTDSLVLDSLAIDSMRVDVPVSPDAIEDEVVYGAKDSTIYDIANKKMQLYGDAFVEYTSINLKADYIEIIYDSNLVYASHAIDSAGNETGIPEFTDGNQSFKAKRMKYNFKSKKGIIYDISTEQQSLYVLGAKAKFISDVETADSTEEAHDVVYSSGAVFTSCNHPEPHFGIRSRKQKMIPNKEVIIGASRLEIMGIPIFWMPFGFFPITSTSRHGLIVPRDYEFSPELGYGIREIGYYVPVNQNLDVQATGDIYFNGSWGLHLTSNFKKKYKYTSRFNFNYSKIIVNPGEVTEAVRAPLSINVNWNQDSKAHPYNTVSANIRFQTNNYASLVENNARNVLTSSYNSSVGFTRRFPTIPFVLKVNSNLSQSSQTGELTMNLPNIDFRPNKPLNPFKRKNGIGKDKWYENINLNYSSQFRNTMTATDSTLFRQEMFDDARYGFDHQVSVNNNIKFLKYFTIDPSISYRERWHFRNQDQQFETMVTNTVDTFYNSDSSEFNIVRDIVTSDSLIINFNDQFRASREYRAGVSINTKLFGITNFKKGPIRGIRHIITPNVSFGYTPDYLSPTLDYYAQTERIINGDTTLNTYNRFQGDVFGSPPQSEASLRASYSINNEIDLKVFSKKTGKTKSIALVDRFSITGNYDFMADSLNWSDISISGYTTLIQGFSNMSYNFSYTPYAKEYSETGGTARRINKSYWQTNRRPLNFQSFNLTLNSRLSAQKLKKLLEGKDESGERKRNLDGSILDLFEKFSIGHNFGYRIFRQNNGVDTSTISIHTLNITGSMELTKNWNIAIGNIGYDFVRQNLTYPDLGFFRKLHCWEMGLSWQPTRGTYGFYIRVAPSSPMNFLNLPWDLRNVDSSRFNF